MFSVLGILVISGIVLLPVLLPIARTDNSISSSKETTSEGAFTDFDKLSIGNVTVKFFCYVLLCLFCCVSYVVNLCLFAGEESEVVGIYYRCVLGFDCFLLHVVESL